MGQALSRTAARRTSQSDSSISRRRASADFDAYPPAGAPAITAVGRPTTNAKSSSTEGKTLSLSLYGCGSSAPAMLRASMLRRGGQMKPDLDENLGRLVRISGAQLSRASVPTVPRGGRAAFSRRRSPACSWCRLTAWFVKTVYILYGFSWLKSWPDTACPPQPGQVWEDNYRAKRRRGLLCRNGTAEKLEVEFRIANKRKSEFSQMFALIVTPGQYVRPRIQTPTGACHKWSRGHDFAVIF